MVGQNLNEAEVSSDAQRIYSALRARGGRITPPRRAIIDALLGANEHLDAEHLTDIVQRSLPNCSFTTIYRTLGALEELGMVHHVHFGHGSSVWHLETDRRPHLSCDTCGGVVHAEPNDLKGLRQRIAKRYGFSLADHFAVVGRCAKCQSH